MREGQSFFFAVSATLLVVAVLILLPVILPWMLILAAIKTLLRRRVAKSFRCLRCGAVLGAESLRLADAEDRRQMDEFFRDHPGVKPRRFRTLHAVCAVCGQHYQYLEVTRTFAIRRAADTADDGGE